MIEYLFVGLKALLVVVYTWLLAAFPLTYAGFMDGEDARGFPRFDVVVSLFLWVLLVLCLVVVAVGWTIDEVLLPLL